MEDEIEFYKLHVLEFAEEINDIIFAGTISERIFSYLIQYCDEILRPIFLDNNDQLPICNLEILKCMAKITDEQCLKIADTSMHWTFDETRLIVENFAATEIKKFTRIYQLTDFIFAAVATDDEHFLESLRCENVCPSPCTTFRTIISNMCLSDDIVRMYYNQNEISLEYHKITLERYRPNLKLDDQFPRTIDHASL